MAFYPSFGDNDITPSGVIRVAAVDFVVLYLSITTIPTIYT